MANIPFTQEKVSQCICPSCPVENQSQCAAGLLSGPKHNPLRHEEVPGLYCAAGTATCRDLDFQKNCICNACPVYMEYRLSKGKPTLYFCRDGEAQSG